jgi:hypothetical protein
MIRVRGPFYTRSMYPDHEKSNSGGVVTTLTAGRNWWAPGRLSEKVAHPGTSPVRRQ